TVWGPAAGDRPGVLGVGAGAPPGVTSRSQGKCVPSMVFAFNGEEYKKPPSRGLPLPKCWPRYGEKWVQQSLPSRARSCSCYRSDVGALFCAIVTLDP